VNIQKAAVIGAGTMGGGIGYVLSAAGIEVLLKDVDQGQLDLARLHVERIYRRNVERERMEAGAAEAGRARVRYSLDYADLGAPDLVVEAVPERMSIKRSVLEELHRRCPPHTILASNTSALSITELGAASGRADRVVGLHFFNPAHVMKLVEVIPGAQTDPGVTQAMLDLTRRLGKTPVAVRECPGFVVNRLLMPYLNEAVLCVQEGAGVAEVDAALGREGFGWPMGPLALMDMLGLDVCHHIIAYLDAAWGARFAEAPLLRALVEAGQLGQKSGHGFYAHGDDRRGAVATEVDTLLAGLREAGQVEPASPAAAGFGVPERTMAMLLNEAFLCVEQEIASVEDIDLACTSGLGMQVNWGGERAPMGPLKYADRVGLDVLLARFEGLEAALGRRFRPAAILREKVRAGRPFIE
jgi:3-hydroxyacyl-CoA dehydrogenase